MECIRVRHALDIEAMDGLLLQLGQCVDAKVSSLQLNLELCEQATAAGISWLLSTLHAVQRLGISTIELVPPDEINAVQHQLTWMHAFDFLHEEGIHVNYPISLLSDPSSVLARKNRLPITRISSEGDVRRVVGQVVEKLKADLSLKLGFGPTDVANLSLMISEACINVCDHAGEGALGLIAAEIVDVKHPYLIVGLADDGCGLRQSLLQAHPEAAHWDEAQVIQEALRQGVSGVLHADRGLGLAAIVSHLSEYQGTLNLCSGGARLRRRVHGPNRFEDATFPASTSLPGTMLSMTLLAKK